MVARTREFDPDRALDDAMGVFWKKGYGDTSVEDLVTATGVNRYGLYDVFESKRGLFLAALAHYRRTVIEQSLAELDRPGADLRAIHATFELLVGRARSGEARYGCLMCNAAEEVSPFDADVAREVASYQRRLVRAFRRVVETAQANGQVAKSLDAREAGHYLSGLIQGASFLARSPASVRAIEDYIRIGLRALA